MAAKDHNMSENEDHSKKDQPKEGINKQSSTGELPASEIKNAHATGDGSFGRNESSVPDKDEEQKAGEPNY